MLLHNVLEILLPIATATSKYGIIISFLFLQGIIWKYETYLRVYVYQAR